MCLVSIVMLCISYRWLCFLCTVVQYLYFRPRMFRSRYKSSSDVVGNAKKCQPFHCTTVPFKVLYCKIKNPLSVVVFFVYYLCEKYYKLITVQYYVEPLNGLPRWCSSKEPTCQCRRHGFSPWVGRIPGRRK